MDVGQFLSIMVWIRNLYIPFSSAYRDLWEVRWIMMSLDRD